MTLITNSSAKCLMAAFMHFELSFEAMFIISRLLSCTSKPSDITKTCLFKYIENFTTKKWKKKNQIKMSNISSYFCSNIHCGNSSEPTRRGSNEYMYQQSMFLSRNKKNNVYPCKPKFYYIEVVLKGVKMIKACFRDERWSSLKGKNLLPQKRALL